jgi:hypothetical protein
MNTSTVSGVLRALIAAASGYAAGKGFDITGLGTPEVTAALGTVIVAIWSVFSKRTPKPTA